MKHFLLFLIPAVIFSCSSVKPVAFQNTKVNYEKKRFRNLLIAGSGDSPTRLFLENLATKLGSKLALKDIHLTYQYLGADYNKSSLQYKALIDTGKFDGILFFNTIGISSTDLFYSNSYGTASAPAYTTTVVTTRGAAVAPINSTSGMINNQAFNMQLYDTKNMASSIWDASLGRHFDFSNQYNYTYISDKIIESFVANKLCD